MAQAQVSKPLPPQYLFVARRDYMLRTTQGACLTFEKGVPTHVPKQLHSLALEKGLLPCDEAGKEVDVAAAHEVMPAELKLLQAPESAEDRNAAILKALTEIVKRNSSKDFGGNNIPNVDSVVLALGWRVDAKEIRNVWNTHREFLLTGKRST